MLNRLSRSILGLDIRSDTVSAVLVKSGLKGVTIEKTAHAVFTATGEGGKDLAAALAKISAEIGISGTLSVVALPFSHLSLRTMDVPFKEPKKIRQILPFELEPALPFPIDQQIVDFIPLTKNEQQDTTSILISAIKQDELKYYLDLLKQAGIDPEGVTLNGHATAMAMASLNRDEDFSLVDIGLKKIMVYVANKGQIQFIRSFPVALDPSKKTALVASNMRHTLLAFEAHYLSIPAPKTVYITGKGADDPEIPEALEKTLGLNVFHLDLLKETDLPFENIKGASWKGHEMSNPLALCYCDAMGLKGFNFRKGPFANRKFWTDNKTDFIKTGILAGIVLLMLLFGGFISTYMLETRIRNVQDEMKAVFKATFPDKKLTAPPFEQMQAELKAQKNSTLFSEEMETDIRTIDLLNELSRTIPDGIDTKFTKLVFSAGSLLISGNTDTFNAVDDMKNRLEKSELFKSVTISSANSDRSGKRVDFKFKIDLS